MKSTCKVVIIGGGPAGIACAVQLKRSGIDPVIFEQGRVGGLLNNAFLVENYPGFPNGISGQSLVNKFKEQLKQWNIPVVHELIKILDYNKKIYLLEGSKKYTAEIVVIASGTKPILPKAGFTIHNDRVLYEVYPIRKKRKKSIAIIGSGDAAFDYGLNLCRNNRVYIINRNKKSKALALLQKRVKKMGDKRILHLNNTWIREIRMRCRGFSLRTNRRDNNRVIICNYLIYAIGREPAVDFISPSLIKRTKVKNSLFFIGDVKNDQKRQTAIAVGDGVKAAMDIVSECRRMGTAEYERKNKK